MERTDDPPVWKRLELRTSLSLETEPLASACLGMPRPSQPIRSQQRRTVPLTLTHAARQLIKQTAMIINAAAKCFPFLWTASYVSIDCMRVAFITLSA